MNASSKSTDPFLLQSDLARVDAHVIQAHEYYDLPDLADKDLADGRLEIGGMPVKRGRPPKADPKEAVSLRVDPDVLAYFKAAGPGWQSRINAALRKAAKLPKAG